jgi:DNA-binding transcriptional ArsR family regulator
MGCLEECVREGVGLFILDSLGIALEGDAGDSRDVIGFHHEYLDPFRTAGVTLVVIDHQGKAQGGERYQSKRTFGSVYKENLARSVLQVEPPGDQGNGLLTVKIRQTKHNFGPKAEPFGVRLTFSEEEITVDQHSLDATELAQEHTLNAGDRVLMVLADGPAYPADIVERTGNPLGTVKNALTRLRKRGLVEDTGEVREQARQVCLTEDGHSVTASQLSKGSVTPVTPPDPPADVLINDKGEMTF